LTFLSSVIAQAASNAVHDAFNERSLWVASEEHRTPYQVYGDDTLFTGTNASYGAKLTSQAAHLSQKSIVRLLNGDASITTDQIRRHFPTYAGSTKDSVMVLRLWARGQEQWARQLSYVMGIGDYTPSLITSPALDGLVVGMHGYVNNVRF
jgi:hypothetical protein